MASPSRSVPFFLRWTLIVTAGETLGFAVAAVVAVSATAAGLSDAARYPIVVAAGAVEGALLGTAQYIGMRQHRPRAGAWIGATSAAAALAWAVGMLASLLPVLPPPPMMIVGAAVGGLIIIASIPLTQWLVLRRRGTFRWVPVNMGAWAVAVLWTVVPSPIVDESTPVAVLVLVNAIAGVLMASTVALLTAHTANRLFGTPRPATTASRAASRSSTP
ncbi:hypothetical protein [Leifsonia sp. AG29]|uniref:hypothetical protein n=1 Tax=Leifsonia sp. AG29 TaxID=2598860 RepID=UPI00131C5C81|nr:hypothetical protein [Leifsonia sp. AG29]